MVGIVAVCFVTQKKAFYVVVIYLTMTIVINIVIMILLSAV